jgi:hypothetical protein
MYGFVTQGALSGSSTGAVTFPIKICCSQFEAVSQSLLFSIMMHHGLVSLAIPEPELIPWLHDTHLDKKNTSLHNTQGDTLTQGVSKSNLKGGKGGRVVNDKLVIKACHISNVVQYSSVGIATHYGLDGPGIECWWGREFPHLSKPVLGSS